MELKNQEEWHEEDEEDLPDLVSDEEEEDEEKEDFEGFVPDEVDEEDTSDILVEEEDKDYLRLKSHRAPTTKARQNHQEDDKAIHDHEFIRHAVLEPKVLPPDLKELGENSIKSKSEEEADYIVTILNEFSDIFAKDDKDLGRTQLLSMS